MPSAADDFTSLLIGGSVAMQPVFVAIAHACASDSPVLITGPTGTGKSLAARVIHANSARRAGPFITLHCAALPEQLLESELFGHEKSVLLREWEAQELPFPARRSSLSSANRRA